MTHTKIILASGSASRKKQLEDMGFSFSVKVSGVDEDIYKNSGLPFSDICLGLAKKKTETAAKDHPEALVLGGDQMAVMGREIFNKTEDPERAVKSLMKLQGRTHTLFTGMHLCYGKKRFSYLEINTMQMRSLTEEQVRHYVKTSKPLNCAGCYALERCGIGLFQKIETSDQSAIIGFPLITLINQLIKWQIPIPFLSSPLKQ